MRVLARRPLGWLLLAVFSVVWVVRSAVGAAIAVDEGESVILFWRVVEAVFFSGVAVAAYRRTSTPSG